MKIDKSDVCKFLFGFVVGVGLTSILSIIISQLLVNNEENKEKKMNDHNANNDLPNDDYNKTMNNETDIDIDIESLFKLRNGKKVNLECIEDLAWSTEIGNYNCKDYERSRWCENGRIGYKWNSTWTWKINSNGQSARDVCCICGGTGVPKASTDISIYAEISTTTPKKTIPAQQDVVLVEPLLEGPCKTLGWNKEICLRKSEVGRFASFMQAGDPCFLKDDGKRWCFVSKEGHISHCSCKFKDCGCEDDSTAIPIPTCDNKEVPKNINSCTPKYCKYPYTKRKSNKHTMCEYCGLGSHCGSTICQYGLSDSEKQEIIDLHNKLRSKIAKGLENRGADGKAQPSAANMKKLSWDDELSTVAQVWANQCLGSTGIWHDKNRRTYKFSSAGQNYASKYHTSKLGDKFLTSMIMDFYDEVQDFPSENISPFSTKNNVPINPRTGKPKMVGHYTQLVWADTYKIGCGFIMFQMKEGYKKVLVCNYGPAGNRRRGEMYKVGKPGSLCQSDVENGLCT